MLAQMPQPGDSYADAAKRRPQMPPKSVEVGMRNPLLSPSLQGSQKERTDEFLERNERWYRKSALCGTYSVPGENASAEKGTFSKQPAAQKEPAAHKVHAASKASAQKSPTSYSFRPSDLGTYARESVRTMDKVIYIFAFIISELMTSIITDSM